MNTIDWDKIKIAFNGDIKLEDKMFIMPMSLAEAFYSKLESEAMKDAVPIEWIKKQIENPPYSHSWELGERWKGEYATCLMVLLEDWEKENETNR